MAGEADKLDLWLGGLRVSNREEPDASSEKQDSLENQPSAPSSEDLLHCTPIAQEWEDEDDDEEEFEVNTPVTGGGRNINQRIGNDLDRSGTYQSRHNTSSRANRRELSNFFKLEVGEASVKGLKFVAFKLIKKYPYLYVGKSNQEEVGTYFKENLLNNSYVWDFFYILDPNGSKDPLLLVPTVQFEQFLNFTNAKIGRNLRIPQGGAQDKFYLEFGDSDTPVPRFLGRVGSEGAYEDLRYKIHSLPHDKLSDLPPTVLQSFKDTMENVYSTFSSKKKKSPEDIKRKQVEKQKSLGRVTKRVQRYLGLRARAAYAPQSAFAAAGWNVEKPAPFIKDSSVRFVCVDVEAYERNNNIVTEIGLAVLDTEDIMDIPPGDDGEHWFPQIKTFHLRIREYSHIVNSDFVQGCPYAFNFGKSEFVPLDMIARRIGSIIGDSASDDKRPVILVGHGIGQDLTYLHKIGYNVWRVPQIQDEVDTSSMYQRLEKGQHGRGLETICRELHHSGYDFHNAGNDAYFTLQSMIVMAFRQMLNPPKNGPDTAENPNDSKEWSDGEYDDGGPPQRSEEPVQKAARQTALQNQEPRW